jgi:hypothetical protein
MQLLKIKIRVARFLLRQPGYLDLKETRGFPSPTHAGFGFLSVAVKI